MRTTVTATLLALGVSFSAFSQSGSYTITTAAGIGNGDGGPATASLLASPQGLTFDGAGNLYIADAAASRVRKVAPDGTITTFAGTGAAGFSGDGGPAASAQLNGPSAVAADKSGNIYIADTYNSRVRMVTPSGLTQTVAGSPFNATMVNVSNVPATSAQENGPTGVAVDSAGNLFISDNSNRIRIVVKGIVQPLVNSLNFAVGYSGDGGQASSALLRSPAGLAVDSNGNLYIADQGNNCIRKVTPAKSADVASSYQLGTITTIAGGPGSTALSSPQAVAVDSAGNVYVADTGNNRIQEITVSGKIVTVAGSGQDGFSGDDGAAASALFNSPGGLAVDGAGNVLIADSGNGRIRKIAANTISTVAGALSVGDGGPAAAALLADPQGLAFDGAGNLYVADANRIRRIATDGTISTFAGMGSAGFGGDGGPATAALLNGPAAVAVDASGNVYIADTFNNRIRRITTDGMIQTVAGPGQLNSPYGVAVDSAGNIFTSEIDGTLRNPGNAHILIVTNGIIQSIVNKPNAGPGFGGDGGPADLAQLTHPTALAVDTKGNLYIADRGSGRIRKVTPAAQSDPAMAYANGTISTIANNLFSPQGVAVDAAGNVYIADTGNNRVVEVTAAGIATLAGSGSPGFSGDRGPAAAAVLNSPAGVAVDSAGNVFIADTGNSRIRELALPPGYFGPYTISTIAGPASSDGSPASLVTTTFSNLSGLAFDGAGNLYISDQTGRVVWKVVIATGGITAFAGTGKSGFSGDNGPATAAQLGSPLGLACDNAGNLYIADGLNNRIRKVAAGVIQTVAGSGSGGVVGDGGPATAASLNGPFGVAVDNSGNLFISENNSNRVRIVANGIIQTIVSPDAAAGFDGDGGPASAAHLSDPRGLAIDASGNLYIADRLNNRVRKVTPSNSTDAAVAYQTGIISTVAGPPAGIAGPLAVAVDGFGDLFIADGNRVREVGPDGTVALIAGGNGGGFSGDGGSGTKAQLNAPWALAVDRLGNVFVAERNNSVIRKLTPVQPRISRSVVLNAASLLSGPVSPGEIVIINGVNLGPAQMAPFSVNASGALATVVAGTQALFDGTPAPLISVQSNQIGAIVPYEVSGEAAISLHVQVKGVASNAVSIPVAAAVPAIFTQDSSGAGQALAFNADSTPNSPQNPASVGSTITFNATGEGQTNPPGVDGQVAGNTPPVPAQTVSVQIGGMDATVVSAGTAPGFAAGFFQVTVQVPSNAPTGGQVPIVLTVGGTPSQPGVTVALQ